MANEIDVRSIKLLESYKNSFDGLSSTIHHKVYSYFSVLENSANHARQLKSRIHSIVERRKAYLSSAKTKMEAAIAERPTNSNHIAVAKKRFEGCKEAYDTAVHYDVLFESLLKKLYVSINQAKQQSFKIKNDLSTYTENGDRFLMNCVMKLKSYSNLDG